MLLVR